MQETTKAFQRRRLDPFWDDIFVGEGIDIGSGDDPFQRDWWSGVDSIKEFDLKDGDAQYLAEYLPSRSFDFLHSSNCLEHMYRPVASLLNWLHIIKVGGHLVITVPDEDLYEQGVFPSQWNQDHKWTFTISKKCSWSSRSINLVSMLDVLPFCRVKRVELVDTNYDYSKQGAGIDQTMGNAEAFIEFVIEKIEPVFPKNRRFRHSGARGDLAYGLAAMKAMGGGTLFISLSPRHYAKGGTPMKVTDVEQFRELLCTQDYVDDVRVWKRGKSDINVNLDLFRAANINCNLLSRSHLMATGADFDLGDVWIDPAKIGSKYVSDIVISRSPRYHGPFDWGHLLPWLDRCTFVGHEDEHRQFQEDTGMDISFHPVESYLEMARVICGSRLFIGNQSFPYSLAEAMKHPRVLEECPACPNCHPQSDNGFTVLTPMVIRHF